MERFVDVLGGRLLVVDDGDGPPILLLHAGIADHRSDSEVPAARFTASRSRPASLVTRSRTTRRTRSSTLR